MRLSNATTQAVARQQMDELQRAMEDKVRAGGDYGADCVGWGGVGWEPWHQGADVRPVRLVGNGRSGA